MSHDPESRDSRLARALELGRAGRAADSLALLESLVTEARDSPDLLAHYGRGLLVANRAADAEAAVTDALTRWPTDATLHVLLAELRWQRGTGDDALSALERAIDAHPDHAPLRLVAANLLRNLGRAPRALEILEGGLARAPESAALLSSIGVVLDDLDRPHEALRHLRAAIPRARDPVRHLANLVPVLLRTGAATEALDVCEELARVLPDEQRLIAYRSTALRMLGDARHGWLCDYARLVRCYRLEPRAPHGGIEDFNAAFARSLRALHHGVRRPIAQTLRGGTQTEQHLPADEPRVAEFFAMLDAPIRDYVSRLAPGDATHPVDRRRRAGYRIAGSWSVRLAPGGFHTDHVHPQGWLSSAYYVELPHVKDDAGRGGWLKFGEPGVRVGLPPEHFVKPEPGMLVLFPSYFWHGTVPFTEGGDRLTAAFDVVPD
jgi:tetratricopeptide (TPR) repeat protein